MTSVQIKVQLTRVCLLPDPIDAPVLPIIWQSSIRQHVQVDIL